MNSNEFGERAKWIERDLETTYMIGGFGQVATKSSIDKLCKQYEWNENVRQNAEKIIDKGFIFDCIGLIKGILWGFYGDFSKPFGGAYYESNGVPDLGSDSFFAQCSSEVGWNRDTLDPGEAVWLPGHIGIYIGDGEVIECTAKWESKVVRSNVTNLTASGSGHFRKWDQHGEIPYLIYETPGIDYKAKYFNLKEEMERVLRNL